MANILYTRYGTRKLRYYRGMVGIYPIMAVGFFILTLGNVGIPITLNFIGELYCFMGIFKISPIATIMGSIGIVLSVTYSFLLYNRIFNGVASPYIKVGEDINRIEMIYISPLIILPIVLGIKPTIITEMIDGTINYIINM